MPIRTMRILELLAGEPNGIRISDLAKELELNRAIPFRILADLVELGYVAQDPLSERYYATLTLGCLGLRQIESSGVQDWALPELNALAAKTRELVRLAMATDEHLRFVSRAQGANSALIIDSQSGSEVALHATASGKAWLSTLDDQAVERLLRERGLTGYTSNTMVTLSQVVRELDDVRRVGYAVVYEEMEPGVSAIAVPVVPPESPDGVAVATVSIAGPTARVKDRLIGYAPELKATSRRLAGRWRAHVYLDASRRGLASVESAAGTNQP